MHQPQSPPQNGRQRVNPSNGVIWLDELDIKPISSRVDLEVLEVPVSVLSLTSPRRDGLAQTIYRVPI